MSLRSRSLSLIHLWAACALAACGGPAEPGDGTMAEPTTSSSASSTEGEPNTSTATETSATSATSSTASTAASDESGPPECTVANYDCPAGFGCSQPNNFDPPFCDPIPEGGCTQVEPCPEGFMCETPSHHTEIGTCEPNGESSGSSGGSTTAG